MENNVYIGSCPLYLKGCNVISNVMYVKGVKKAQNIINMKPLCPFMYIHKDKMVLLNCIVDSKSKYSNYMEL